MLRFISKRKGSGAIRRRFLFPLVFASFLSPGSHACESFVSDALNEVHALFVIGEPSLSRSDFTDTIRALDALVPPLRQCVMANAYKRYMRLIADVTVLRADLAHTVKAMDNGLYARDPLIRTFWRKKAQRFLDEYSG